MAKNKFDVDGKLVVVAGGSRGLGKAMALELAAKGANILLLARTHAPLLVARQDVQAACQSSRQIVDAIPVDLTKPDEVSEVLLKYHSPDILICTAGHTPPGLNSQTQTQTQTEPKPDIRATGLLADLPTSSIQSTVDSTFYATIFIVQSCLKRWRSDAVTRLPGSTRHIILTSAIEGLGVGGCPDEYGMGHGGVNVAYAASKAAIRSLADTLRAEALCYSAGEAFQVHVSFPGRVVMGGGDWESRSQLGRDGLWAKLSGGGGGGGRVQDAGTVARKILRGVEQGRTYITVDFRGEVLLNGMRGPSPRFWTLYEFFLGMVAGVVWWVLRVGWDRRMRRYGREQGWD